MKTPAHARLAALTFLVLTALPGCAIYQKNQMLKEEPLREDATVPLVLTGVKVGDRRKGVEDRALRIPVLEYKQTDALQPVLTEAQSRMIESELERYFVGGKRQVFVVAEVLKGVETYEAKITRAREQSEVEIQLTFYDPSARQALFWSKGSAQMFIESMSASKKDSQALYEKVLRQAVYQAMREVKNEYFSN